MSTLAHYFVGGVLLSSSTTWLKYFVGYSLSITDTAVSFASRDIPLWRWTMLLGILNCVWGLGTLFPSSVEGIGGWTLQAPKFAILAGLVSGIGAKVRSNRSNGSAESAYRILNSQNSFALIPDMKIPRQRIRNGPRTLQTTTAQVWWVQW
jgi:hypothetical protein